jgi:hypothetical protein
MNFTASSVLATALQKRQVGSEILYDTEYTIQSHICRTLTIAHRCYQLLVRQILSDFIPEVLVCEKVQYLTR